MAEPELVAECVAAMQNAVSVPVTVKTRIGIDDRDSYEELAGFIRCVREQGGCETFIIHARKAYLEGLSPKENRTVPPLDYEYAYRIKRQFPELVIIVNGGVQDLDATEPHLKVTDGVMLGRAAYHNPYLLAQADARIFNDPHLVSTREEIVNMMLPYIARELNEGSPLKHITRHMLGLFQGMPGARHWRRHLSEYAPRPGAGTDVVTTALDKMAGASGVNLPSTGYTQHHG